MAGEVRNLIRHLLDKSKHTHSMSRADRVFGGTIVHKFNRTATAAESIEEGGLGIQGQEIRTPLLKTA